MFFGKLFKAFWTCLRVILCALCVEVCADEWSISEEVFYWIAHEQGLGYTNQPADILTTDDFTKNSLVSLSNEWKWGFRLGASFSPTCSNWFGQGYWTYCQAKAHGSHSVNSASPSFQGMYPVWSMGPDSLASDYIASAAASWYFHGNLLDLNALYTFRFVKNTFLLSPLFGGRGTELVQKLTARYTGGVFFSGADKNHLQSRYLGGGPRLGLRMDYCLGREFWVFGRGAAAPLFGYFQLQQDEMYLDANRFHRSTIDHHWVLSADYQIGFLWKGLIIQGHPYITVALAWEGQEFFYANQFYRGAFHFFPKNRDLFLQGITASFALNF